MMNYHSKLTREALSYLDNVDKNVGYFKSKYCDQFYNIKDVDNTQVAMFFIIQ